MIPYHKIQTVFKRDPATNFKTLLEGQYALPAFEYLKNNEWEFTEKIDGTNIRIMWKDKSLTFGGKTDNAQIPAFLFAKLQQLFSVEQMTAYFPDSDVCLYGEGFGERIQKGGGNYIKDGVDFILFDVRIGHWWLTREGVVDIAHQLHIMCVPIVAVGPLGGMINMVRDGFNSAIGTGMAEGVVARPAEDLFMRNGDRVITKLKHKDFNG
jgi:ATP-dependent RNA circularization protein (DNA/RNA ligase family)